MAWAGRNPEDHLWSFQSSFWRPDPSLTCTHGMTHPCPDPTCGTVPLPELGVLNCCLWLFIQAPQGAAGSSPPMAPRPQAAPGNLQGYWENSFMEWAVQPRAVLEVPSLDVALGDTSVWWPWQCWERGWAQWCWSSVPASVIL